MATTRTPTIQDVTDDFADLTEQIDSATGRHFRITYQDGLVRLEKRRTGEEWQDITPWIRADQMELYCDAYLSGIHEGYMAAKRGR